ncbi:uncharacterized protein LOC144663008 isoform X2 [Oculina patagonica]
MASPTDAEDAFRSTKGKENFQRLTRLLMCGGVRLLREMFDSFHSPTDLPLKLGDPAIQTQLRRARISKPEWDSLYPSPGTFGKSADFDITLTFRLLRTICNLTEPPTGWDNLPNSTDYSLEADLARIKFYRNSIYGHNTTMEITDSAFGNFWTDISEALLRIAESISPAKRVEWMKSIDKLLRDPLTTEAQRYVDELQLWYKNDMEVKDAVEQVGNQLQQVNTDIRAQLQQVYVDVTDQLQQVNTDIRDQLQQLQQRQDSQPVRITIVVEVHHYHHQGYRHGPPMPKVPKLTFWNVIKERSLKVFLQYLKAQLGLGVESYNLGSVLVTVTCSSLQILEGLWQDYSSGHLNKVAEQTLATSQVLEELGLDELKLKTTILEDEYRKCKEFFLGNADKKQERSLQEPTNLDDVELTMGSGGKEKKEGREIKASKPPEDDISQLCSRILDYKVGTYEDFHDALDSEMDGCSLNIALFGMTGSGKSALINTIFQSLDLDSEPAVTQSMGKEGTKILETCVLPGNQITLYDTRGFFELNKTEEGELFRILFGIERAGDDLTRDYKSAQKAEAAGVGAHRLKRPPILDRIHVVLWVIKANDIRFQTGQYREIIKFVQDRLKQEIITIITVITFDDQIQKKPDADEERKKLKKAAIEVTGSDKKNVFFIANSVRGHKDHDSEYKKRVLEMLEQALKCGERSIRMRQSTRERPKKQARYSESDTHVG